VTLDEAPSGGAAAGRLAYILRSYPRLSQTFILNEILGLERLGYRIDIFGMIPSGETLVQEGVASVRGRTEFLDGALRRSPLAIVREHARVASRHPGRYLRTALYVGRRPDLTAGYTTTTRRASFMQAVYLASKLGPAGGVDHVHSHFAHDPTLIALLLYKLTGRPYSFTAHARDMLQIPESSLAERIKHAKAVVSICRANIEYMRKIAPDADPTKFRLVRTGIEVEEFKPSRAPGGAGDRPTIVSVGRLVQKKGFGDLVGALARVKSLGRRFRCLIFGEGPLRDELAQTISRAGLDDFVELAGACTLARLTGVLRQADIFALTPFVTPDGDRDGLPSAILEAMACGLPVVSTAVAGIPEAVVHGRTGLLADPRDLPAIASHVTTLIDDESLRRRLGARAREAIVRQWSSRAAARELASVFAGAAQNGT
jgi:glycosyltransferase involved in cell wall biosynthesis